MKANILFLIFVAATSLIGCSENSGPKHRRDISFYQPMINSSVHYSNAAEKMNELVILTSNQKYTMRYAIFDNGKFYYEVGNLGSGNGSWSFKDGYINLHAIRPYFDMDLDLVATEAIGENIAMQFVDRFGQNTVVVQMQPPSMKPLRRLEMPENGEL